MSFSDQKAQHFLESGLSLLPSIHRFYYPEHENKTRHECICIRLRVSNISLTTKFSGSATARQ